MTKLNDSSEQYFTEAYEQVMYTGAVGLYSKFTHIMMERSYRNKFFSFTLELGAGHGQHFPFVQHKYDKYLMTDIDPELSKSILLPDNAERAKMDAQNLSGLESGSVDRIIATCLLAHLDAPDAALAEWNRVLKDRGVLTIYVPCEPGILLRMARWLLVAPKSRKYGQDHHSMIYQDHRNHYPGMSVLLKKHFSGAKIKKFKFPLPFFGWNLNLFEIWHIEK